MTAAQEGPQLSKAAQSLWGKSDYGEEREWLPLFMHMYDSKCVAERLWDTWVPDSTQSTIRRGLGPHASFARDLFVFLASIHDLGKATPCFQAMPVPSEFRRGLCGPQMEGREGGSHPTALKFQTCSGASRCRTGDLAKDPGWAGRPRKGALFNEYPRQPSWLPTRKAESVRG